MSGLQPVVAGLRQETARVGRAISDLLETGLIEEDRHGRNF